ncbi:MAG: methyltransferase domain-containing protein [bacterium]|nr:methyltransferase domain-containing protein [bacterium]
MQSSSQPNPFLSLPHIPVHVCVLWPTEEAARNAPRGDFELVVDPETGMAINQLFDESLLGYGDGYENSLGFSEFFQGYLQGFAKDLVERYSLKGKRVVEIGCGDANFLSLMIQHGAGSGVGFDPSYHEGQPTSLEEGRVEIRREYFPPPDLSINADILVCRQVLEHVSDPLQFLKMIRSGLPKDHATTVVMEVPNFPPALARQTAWDMIYEHCTYFSAGSLARLLSKAGFNVIYAEETYAKQFVTVEATTNPNAIDRTPEFDDLVELEKGAAEFEAAWTRCKVDWKNRLEQANIQGKKVAIWGTGARGINFLNLVDPERTIQCAVDINPRKYGLHVAGTGQVVSPPEALLEYRPDLVIIINPIYEQEIRNNLRNLGLNPEIAFA